MTVGVPLAERLFQVRAGIADAARDASRDLSTITTIVVTKFHPASMVRELHGLGVRDFGESRHQEAQPKVAELADLQASWHFVGQLQSKKARQVSGYIDVLHSMDRDSLADALVGNSLEVFLQVNLTDDPGRGGVEPGAVQQLAERVHTTDGLTLMGLMAVAPLGVDARAAFSAVREMSETLVGAFPTASALSIGMSGDYREAILEGATHLRIGAAITGNRPVAG